MPKFMTFIYLYQIFRKFISLQMSHHIDTLYFLFYNDTKTTQHIRKKWLSKQSTPAQLHRALAYFSYLQVYSQIQPQVENRQDACNRGLNNFTGRGQ